MKTTSEIVATASCRADLAGGTVDIWPLYLFHPGAVTVNIALNILTECRIRPCRGREVTLISRDTGRRDRFASVAALMKARRFQHPVAGMLCRQLLGHDGGSGASGFTLTTDSASPAGAGISGSSALMIATTAALSRFCGRQPGKEEIRVIAQNVEAQIIRVPTGCQDYYPALYGGVSAIHLKPDGIRREAIPVPAAEMNERFLLAYTGAPRQSGINNWEVFKAHIGGDRRVQGNFNEIVAIARAMHDALASRRWLEVARLLRAEWKLRKTNAPGISTPQMDRMIAAALRHGARAAKVCGAGGGGCVIFFVEPEARERVAQAVVRHGGKLLPFRVASKGLQVRTE